MKAEQSFPLRFINDMVCNTLDENQLQNTESRLKIIRDNQKYTGLKDYPEIKKSLKDTAEFLLWLSENEESCLANVISGMTTNVSILELNIAKLRKEYHEESLKIKETIDNSGL
jgi:hypothetical protein